MRGIAEGRGALRSGGGGAAVVCLLVVLLCAACSEDEPSCPHTAYGYVAGQVIAGGVPTSASVTLRSLSHWRNASSISLPVESDGSFCFAVAAGDYELEYEGRYTNRLTYSADGESNGYRGPADTLHVADGDTIRADFRLGSLLVDVDLPPRLDHVDVHLTALRPSVSGFGSQTFTAETDWTLQGLARFVFPALPPGAYALRLYLPVLGGVRDEQVWLPGAHRPNAAESIRVEVGRLIRNSASLPQVEATIRGQVAGSWQIMGTAYPQISLVTADSLVCMPGAHTRSDGSFSIPVVLCEPVRVLISLVGTERWIGGESFATATLFDLQPGVETDAGCIVESGLLLELLEPAARMRGSFEIELVRPGETVPARTLQVESYGGSNLVPFPNVDPGTYLVHIDNGRLAMNWCSQWFDRAATSESATAVTVPAGGAVTPLAVHLEPGGSVSGSVPNDSLGNPEKFVVYVATAETRETVGQIHMCEGCSCGYTLPFQFHARGLPDGRYRVGVLVGDHCPPPWSAPLETVWFPGTTDWDSAAVVTITDHADVSGIDISVP
jgi:hypothetical protein